MLLLAPAFIWSSGPLSSLPIPSLKPGGDGGDDCESEFYEAIRANFILLDGEAHTWPEASPLLLRGD